MKNTLKSLSVVAIAFIALFMFSTSAYSAPEGGKKAKREGRGGGPAQMAKRLGLDEEQKGKFTAVMKEFQGKQREVMQNPDLDREGKMAARKELMEARNAKLAEFLSDEQMAKVKKMGQRGGNRGGKEGRKGKGKGKKGKRKPAATEEE